MKSGQFHKHGNHISRGINAMYKTGDVATLIINMEEYKLICMLNNVEVYTFTEIAEEVIPCICLGDSSQNYTVSFKEYALRV